MCYHDFVVVSVCHTVRSFCFAFIISFILSIHRLYAMTCCLLHYSSQLRKLKANRVYIPVVIDKSEFQQWANLCLRTNKYTKRCIYRIIATRTVVCTTLGELFVFPFQLHRISWTSGESFIRNKTKKSE